MLTKLSQVPIRLRLPIMIVTALISCVAILSSVFYLDFRSYSLERAQSDAESVVQQITGDLTAWHRAQQDSLSILSQTPRTRNAMSAFVFATRSDPNRILETARQAYAEDNPHPDGSRDSLVDSGRGSLFDTTHSQFHEDFRTMRRYSGYSDIFLISPEGRVLYSVEKNADFAQSLTDGTMARSSLGEVFRLALSTPPGQVVEVDFERQSFAPETITAFMATRITDPSGLTLGVVAAAIPIAQVARALETDAARLQEGRLVYLLGADGTFRGSSARIEGIDAMDALPSLRQIVASREGTGIFHGQQTGLQGRDVIVAAQGMELFGGTWAVIAEIDEETAFATLASFTMMALGITGGACVISVALGLMLARSITQPLDGFSKAMEGLAKGDFDTPVYGSERGDEIGVLLGTLEALRSALKKSRAASEKQAREARAQAKVVEELGAGLRVLAAGDLTRTIEDPFLGTYEGLREDFNATIDSMNALLRQIVESAQEIRSRAEEISGSSDSLASRTESQAATLEQTAAALDELTASVRSAAESASEVESVVGQARKEAEQSGTVVSDAVDAMSKIRTSSNEISQIIGVIDDIAFQTNLLALNAGVEAARAGEAGRGFAVVASEVRALAQRSADAAKQIKTLISSSREQVETGAGLVSRAGGALTSIIERVGNIDRLVGGIATGAREQSVALAEINMGMTQLDQVTQQNAAMVQEATQSTSDLRGGAASMAVLVSRFRLKGEATSPERYAAVPTPAQAMPDPSAEPSMEFVTDTMIAKSAAGAERWQDF